MFFFSEFKFNNYFSGYSFEPTLYEVVPVLEFQDFFKDFLVSIDNRLQIAFTTLSEN